MKQTKIFTGGHPLSGDDITHTQTGMTESVIALAKGLLSNGVAIPNCILYGFIATPAGMGFVNYSAGAAVLDGEICIFAGATVNPALVIPQHFVIRPSDTYPATNPVTYADASTKNVHLDRVAIIAISVVATAFNEIDLDTGVRFLDVLKTNLSTTEAWRLVGAVGQPASPSWPWYDTGSQIYFRKRTLLNAIEIRGAISLTGTAAISDPPLNYTLFTMPAGYIPSNEIDFISNVKNGGAGYQLNSNGDAIKNLNMKIDNSGNVSLTAEAVPANNDYSCQFYALIPLS